MSQDEQQRRSGRFLYGQKKKMPRDSYRICQQNVDGLLPYNVRMFEAYCNGMLYREVHGVMMIKWQFGSWSLPEQGCVIFG